MTEMEKCTRLAGAANFKVFWGPDAHKVTAEERAAAINRAFDAIEIGDYEVVTSFDDD